MKTNCDDAILEKAAEVGGDEIGGDDELSRLSGALAHPARVAILRLLRAREVCICGEIVEELPLAQSTVSQHLKVLKDAGWIRAREDGVRVCYDFQPQTLQRFRELLQSL